jgi:hypothetical protein
MKRKAAPPGGFSLFEAFADRLRDFMNAFDNLCKKHYTLVEGGGRNRLDVCVLSGGIAGERDSCGFARPDSGMPCGARRSGGAAAQRVVAVSNGAIDRQSNGDPDHHPV